MHTVFYRYIINKAFPFKLVIVCSYILVFPSKDWGAHVGLTLLYNNLLVKFFINEMIWFDLFWFQQAETIVTQFVLQPSVLNID